MTAKDETTARQYAQEAADRTKQEHYSCQYHGVWNWGSGNKNSLPSGCVAIVEHQPGGNYASTSAIPAPCSPTLPPGRHLMAVRKVIAKAKDGTVLRTEFVRMETVLVKEGEDTPTPPDGFTIEPVSHKPYADEL